MDAVQQQRVASLRESTNYTPAQRVRQKHTPRRWLKNNKGLSPFRAVLEACILADEVLEDMIALGMDPRTEKLFCAIGVQHSGNTFRTILLDPTPGGISAVTKEIDLLTEPKVLGCLFRIYDFKAGVSRNWARPFVPGESVRKILLRALQEQDKKESKTMGWFETANEAAPSALYMAIAWAHEDGHIVNVPFTDLARASFAEAELIGEKFFPALVLMLIPGNVDGLEIRSIIIPALGTRERITAAAAVPAAIQAFRQQAIDAGIESMRGQA